MRYFFSSGEASGELAATLLAEQIRKFDTAAQFEGIGGARMREAGFTMWRDHRGWASLGPLAALPRIPKLYAQMIATAAHIKADEPDAVVLVDFGAFNVRLAQRLRRAGYTKPIVDLFPPGAWLDRESAARAVSGVATPVPAFEHQRDFFASLGLPVTYFGHPLIAQYPLRPPRAAPEPDAGLVALLPGSRVAEIRAHVPLMAKAYRLLQARRPRLRAIAGAPQGEAKLVLRKQLMREQLHDVPIVTGAATAVRDADAAFVASGTAVLECALSGVPSVALYKVSRWLAAYARRIYGGRFVTIPNLVLQREIVPELLQERATAENLCAAMEHLLQDPRKQYGELLALRAALGSPDALENIAQFVVESARRAC